jgi:two-component system, OmpR family, phosphate regulon response regulator PhoB
MADGSPGNAGGLRVGVVEDQPEIVTLLQYNLAAAGYRVEVMDRGDEAEVKIQEQPPDLLILDWMLPGLSGIELLRRLRRWPKTQHLPIIVLTARNDEADLIRALETGADDFIAKPFSLKELVARVEALLRRRAPGKVAAVLTAGDIEFDRETMCVTRGGKVVQLAPTDYRLLEVFLLHPGRVLNRQTILDTVWGRDIYIDERTIDVHVGRLRKCLLAGGRTDPITTIRGAGYRFDPS